MKNVTVKKRQKISGTAVKIVIGVVCAVLIAYMLSMLFMLFWGLLSSFKSQDDFAVNVLGLPKINAPWKGKDDPRSSYKYLVQFKNYKDVISQFRYVAETSFYQGSKLVSHTRQQSFFTLLLSSVLYAAGNGFLQAIIPAIMAYMCAKYAYKFSKAVYMVVLVVMTLPIIGAYPSELILLRNLGLYDTWYGNFIQRCSFTGMYFLVFYELFKGMPDTYSEAAEIDGASQLVVMVRIYLPLAAKMIASVFLIKFIFFWNDFSSIELYMPTHQTLAYYIYLLSTNNTPETTSDVPVTTPLIISACMILAVPTIILFLALQNKLMGSMTLGGIKE